MRYLPPVVLCCVWKTHQRIFTQCGTRRSEEEEPDLSEDEPELEDEEPELEDEEPELDGGKAAGEEEDEDEEVPDDQGPEDEPWHVDQIIGFSFWDGKNYTSQAAKVRSLCKTSDGVRQALWIRHIPFFDFNKNGPVPERASRVFESGCHDFIKLYGRGLLEEYLVKISADDRSGKNTLKKVTYDTIKELLQDKKLLDELEEKGRRELNGNRDWIPRRSMKYCDLKKLVDGQVRKWEDSRDNTPVSPQYY